MAGDPPTMASDKVAIQNGNGAPIQSQPTGLGPATRTPPHDVESALERHGSLSSAESLASIDRPPSREEKVTAPAARVYHPFHPEVLALLAPAAVFGLLARLGLQALVKYDGESIFPLAYVQSIGCLIMGFTLRLKDPLGN